MDPVDPKAGREEIPGRDDLRGSATSLRAPRDRVDGQTGVAVGANGLEAVTALVARELR